MTLSLVSRAIAFVLLALVVVTPTVNAQAEPVDTESVVGPSIPMPLPQPEGLDSCFDYYTFGSVSAVPGSQLTSVIQGAPTVFTIAITNNNPYPVVDAAVYGKLMHSRGDVKDANGPDVLSFFPIEQGMTLAAGETKVVTYQWNVPSDLQPGDYRFVTYVAASDRFNLLGLSFTDDIVGNSFDFMVVGEEQGAVRFTKDSVKVGEQAFFFAAYPPHVSSEITSVPVTAVIENTHLTAQDLSVTWKLYAWDALRNENLISEATEQVAVGVNASTTVSYTAEANDDASVYLLVGSFTTASGESSYINVRFVRDGGKSAPRLNDVAVTGYPSGETTKAFACFHSTNVAANMDGRVELRATRADLIGSVLSMVGLGTIASTEYEGAIPGEIYALAMPLPDAPSSFDLTAKIYQDGKLLDQVTVPYRCDALGAACGDTTVWMIIALVGLVIGILLIVVLVIRARHRAVVPGPTLPRV